MRFIFLLVFISIYTTSNATDSTWKQVIKNFYSTNIKLKFIQAKGDKSLISQLQVIDLRHNKEQLGFYTNNLYNPYKIVFEKDEKLETFLIQKLVGENPSGKNILMVVRDFWMTDIFPARQLNKDDKPVVITSKIICKLDVFLKEDDKYIALTRLDTTIWDRRKIDIAAVDLLENLLSILHQNIAGEISGNKYDGRKKLDLEFLQNHYSKKLEAAFNSSTILKKGLYKTYEDFKNNTPVNVEFEITKNGDEPDLLYVKDEKGNLQLTRDIWGVNDGKNIYIMQSGHVFRVYKEGNAFYWMGLKIIKVKNVGVPAGVPLGGGWILYGLEHVATRVQYKTTPYLLNFETGQQY